VPTPSPRIIGVGAVWSVAESCDWAISSAGLAASSTKAIKTLNIFIMDSLSLFPKADESK
jgi:hypothetical protein